MESHWPVLPLVAQWLSVPTKDLDTCFLGPWSSQLEPCRKDDAVQLNFFAVCYDTFLADGLYTFPLGIHERDIRLVEGGQVFVVKAWSFTLEHGTTRLAAGGKE